MKSYYKPLQIVLAEDDENDRMNFKEALAASKMETNITIVNDGVELMEYLEQEDVEVPALLFLDLNMPRKNGMECLLEIRQIPKYRDMVIAIYSTSSSEKDIEQTFFSGANVYMKKPTDFAVLKEMLHKIVTSVNVYSLPPFNIANFLLRL
jgi:CheY-like chemotaxis protein